MNDELLDTEKEETCDICTNPLIIQYEERAPGYSEFVTYCKACEIITIARQ